VKVTTEELERCEVLMTIEVEPAKEQDMLRKAAKRIAREVQIPGFRRGKAPFNTVVRRFGLEAVQQEALESAAEKLLDDALKEADLRPVAQISFDSIDWNPLTLKVKVPGPPQVELGDYRDLRLEFEPVEVSPEEVAEELETLREQNAAWAPVDRPSQLDDLLDMAVIEKDGDEILADHESVEYELTLPDKSDSDGDGDEDEAEVDEVDSEEPDLTTPLLGLSAGEEKTFSISYPEDYSDDGYAGKEITFEVKINSVKEKDLDPLDDDFAQSISEFDTLDELKEHIESNLKVRREVERDQKLGEEMLDKIIEGAKKVEWPVAFEEETIDDEVNRMTNQLRQSGLKLENYLQIEGKTEEDFREDIRESSRQGLERSIVLGELAALEQLSVNQSEILERAKTIADMFGGGSEQIWQSILGSEAQQGRLANEMLVQKVIMRLAAIAKGDAPEPGVEDIEEDATDATDTEAESDNSEAPTLVDEAVAKDSTAEPIAEDDNDNAADEETETPVATKA